MKDPLQIKLHISQLLSEVIKLPGRNNYDY